MRILAECLMTFPCEDDMRDFCEGNVEPCDVKIYYKGSIYLVLENFKVS